MRRYLWLALTLGATALWASTATPISHAQPSACTTVLSPDQTIQGAIDDARRGDVICLASGTWEGNLEITHSLTLRGIGDARSTIRGTEEADDQAVVRISGSTREVRVVELQNLQLLGAESGTTPIGVHVVGSSLTQSASLIVQDVHVANAGAGLWLIGPDVSARIHNSVIEDNASGITARRNVTLSIADTGIHNNGSGGLSLASGTRATVRDSTIRGHSVGPDTGVTRTEVGIGILVGERSHLRLINSSVLDNGSAQPSIAGHPLLNAGVMVGIYNPPTIQPVTSASAEIVTSRIDGNRWGVIVGPNADLSMENSQVRGNLNWGLVAWGRPCLNQSFVPDTEPSGELEFSGSNVIKGNNASGRLDDRGNPGRHPFHHLPDGQVCLPR